IARNTRTTLGFTAVGAFTAYGKTVTQTQYIAEKYVVTEVERGIFIFLGSRKERFLVDLAAGGLRRLEPPARRIGRETLQSVIGEIAVRRDDAPVEVEGFLCERYHFSSTDARIVIEGETLAA